MNTSQDIEMSTPKRSLKAYLDGAILTCTYEKPRVRAPRQSIYSTDMSTKGRDELARSTIPQAHTVVPSRTCGPPPVRTERDVRDLALVACEPRDRLELPTAGDRLVRSSGRTGARGKQ